MEKKSTTPPVYILAWLILISGVILLLVTAIANPATALFQPLAYLALFLISLGTGELFNHPQEEVRELENNYALYKVQVKKTRRRNPCSLGNIFDIVAILFFFIAAAKFFFGH